MIERLLKRFVDAILPIFFAHVLFTLQTSLLDHANVQKKLNE